jgi:hypothetical protein
LLQSTITKNKILNLKNNLGLLLYDVILIGVCVCCFQVRKTSGVVTIIPSPDTVTAKDITFLSTFNYIRGHSTYAEKIAMLQAVNQKQPLGHAPPIITNNGKVMFVPIQSQEKQSDNDKKVSSDFGPIVGQFIRPDIPISDKSEMAEALTEVDRQRQMLALAKIPPGPTDGGLVANVQFVKEEGMLLNQMSSSPGDIGSGRAS